MMRRASDPTLDGRLSGLRSNTNARLDRACLMLCGVRSPVCIFVPGTIYRMVTSSDLIFLLT